MTGLDAHKNYVWEHPHHHISFPYSTPFHLTALLPLSTPIHIPTEATVIKQSQQGTLEPSILIYLQPYGKFQGPSKRDYIQRATNTSSSNQPMAGKRKVSTC